MAGVVTIEGVGETGINRVFPQLAPSAGLTVPWAEYQPNVTGSGDMSCGPDGVALGMVILVWWSDLGKALQQLLGYAYRDPGGNSDGTSRLGRVLPWRHPKVTQLYCRRVVKVMGIRQTGAVIDVLTGDQIPLAGAQLRVGQPAPAEPPGVVPDPTTGFVLGMLTLEFWRPPYYVRSDSQIKDSNGKQQEWLRYVEPQWQLATTMIGRAQGTLLWGDGSAIGNSAFPLAQKLAHLRLRLLWHEIPAAALFTTTQDGTPIGIPTGLLYTRTQTTNPVTGYVRPPGLDANNNITTAATPITDCVNYPLGLAPAIFGGTPTAQQVQAQDNNLTNRFWGALQGTLAYLGATPVPRPLHLPPGLMGIPALADQEPLAQTQFDVAMDFDWFCPPVGNTVNPPTHGWNTIPFAGDGLWYSVKFQENVAGTTTPTTPSDYADFTDLFQIL